MQVVIFFVCGFIFECRKYGVEFCVFLFLVVSSMVISFVVKRTEDLSFVVVAAAMALRDVALVALVLFFLWRNGEPRACIGWTTKRVAREVVLGVVLFFVVAVVVGVVIVVLCVFGFLSM